MSGFGEYDFGPAVGLINEADRILLAGHISPDGDTVGSTLALYHMLKKMGKQPKVVFQDDIPEYLCFLPGIDEIVKPGKIDFAPDLLLLVDCATLDRTGDGWFEKLLPKAPLLIFDHHAMRDDIPAVSLIDPRLAATAELVYWLAGALGVEIDLNMARCIYTAISTDTGGFRFTNTREHTFKIAAHLRGLGVSLEEMRVNLFESRSLPNLQMMGWAMVNMQQTDDRKLVWSAMDWETKQRLGAKPGDTDSIAGQTMMVAGVKVGVFFDERRDAEGKPVVKISFRGRNGYNVGQLAAQFGGGGHLAASGCTVPGHLADVQPKILAAAERLIAYTEKQEN